VLVGSKLALALLTARSRLWLTGSVYTLVIRSLGVLLWVLAVLLFYDGVQMVRA
jgi:ABC-type arginine transport system permease subunit